MFKCFLFQVQNELRELTFKVFIRVPVKLGDADIWTDSNLQVCEFIYDFTSHTGIVLKAHSTGNFVF